LVTNTRLRQKRKKNARRGKKGESKKFIGERKRDQGEPYKVGRNERGNKELQD
jgi:hypothetical protein